MANLIFASVADDDTGASDLAGMLASEGVRSLLLLDASILEEGHPLIEQAQAVVLATATRAMPPLEAGRIVRDSLLRATSLQPRIIQIKYCSTFDSTEEGNIGPSLDAAMDALTGNFTIATPALPVNGRTTCWGYHFVHGQLLSESPMRHHPLTPMANPNLVDHLQRQTRRRVALTPYPVVASGPAAILRHWSEQMRDGVQITVTDCLDDGHASAIAEAACELRLISGSSIFGAALPAVWRRRGWLGNPDERLWGAGTLAPGKGLLVVAGSCSPATAAQNAWLEVAGATVFALDARRLLEDSHDGLADQAAREIAAGRAVLLKIRSSPEEIAETQLWGAEIGWTVSELGLRLAASLASLTRAVLERQIPAALICAGGETSGAICRELGIRAFAVGRNIQPGVPLCFPLHGPRTPVVLKSGNFGSEDFYSIAWKAAQTVRGEFQP